MAIVETLNVNGKTVSITIDDPDMPFFTPCEAISGCTARVSAAALASAARALFTSTV